MLGPCGIEGCTKPQFSGRRKNWTCKFWSQAAEAATQAIIQENKDYENYTTSVIKKSFSLDNMISRRNIFMSTGQEFDIRQFLKEQDGKSDYTEMISEYEAISYPLIQEQRKRQELIKSSLSALNKPLPRINEPAAQRILVEHQELLQSLCEEIISNFELSSPQPINKNLSEQLRLMNERLDQQQKEVEDLKRKALYHQELQSKALKHLDDIADSNLKRTSINLVDFIEMDPQLNEFIKYGKFVRRRIPNQSKVVFVYDVDKSLKKTIDLFPHVFVPFSSLLQVYGSHVKLKQYYDNPQLNHNKIVVFEDFADLSKMFNIDCKFRLIVYSTQIFNLFYSSKEKKLVQTISTSVKSYEPFPHSRVFPTLFDFLDIMNSKNELDKAIYCINYDKSNKPTNHQISEYEDNDPKLIDFNY